MIGAVYIQPIFVPNERLFARNHRSIESFRAYLDAHPPAHPVHVVFGGWGLEPYLSELTRLIADRLPDAAVHLHERNFGKAHVVNDLYDRFVRGRMLDAPYLLLADSDIVFLADQPHLFERLEEAARRFSAHLGKPFGLLAPDQREGSVHLPCIRENRVFFTNRYGAQESIVYPNGSGGIAGSCLYTSRRAWESVGGYRRMGVYAGDDGFYLQDVAAKGMSYAVAESIPVVHPPEDDMEYAHWKMRVCHRDSDGRVDKDLSEILDEAESFWTDRRPG